VRTSRLTLTLGLVAALGLAARADAVLAPSKASQLVTVSAFGACPIVGFSATNSVTFANLIRSDGTSGAFTIPPKQVFVITDVILAAAGMQANDAVLSIVAVGTPNVGSPIAGRYDSASPGGAVTSSFVFPAGVAVKSPSLVCAEMINTTQGGSVFLSAVAHGYFAPDK
jgi:hypothetical protein